jgi:hypothetical protein
MYVIASLASCGASVYIQVHHVTLGVLVCVCDFFIDALGLGLYLVLRTKGNP